MPWVTLFPCLVVCATGSLCFIIGSALSLWSVLRK